MGDFKHPLGNFKVQFLKGVANLFSLVSIYILSLFYKIDKKKNEIIISSSFFAPWKDDVHFKYIYKKIKTDTLLDTKRLYTLWQASFTLKDYSGDILDLGCLKGGAGMLMSKNNLKGKTILIDTFEGLVESENYHHKDHFVFKDINSIKNKIKKLKLKNISVHKGVFPTDFKKKYKNKRFKLCHIDVNTFKSTSLSFDFIKDKIIKNGIIIFDDYGIVGVYGVKKFVDQIKKKNKNFIFLNNYMGQCILIRK